MPLLGVTHFALPEAGGQERDPSTIFSHRMPGASDEDLLQNAITMKVDAHREEDEVIVEVKITNDLTGHHVPTDSPLRQMILLVQALDGNGNALEQINGSRIPEYGGVGKLLSKAPSKSWHRFFPADRHNTLHQDFQHLHIRGYANH